MYDINMMGIKPQLRQLLEAQAKFNADDVAIVVSRDNVTAAATSSEWSYVVPFEMQTAAGELIPFSGDVAAAAADTSTAGTASVSDATPSVDMGVGNVTLSGDAAAWLAAETATLTVSFTTAYGSSISDTFVVTFE